MNHLVKDKVEGDKNIRSDNDGNENYLVLNNNI